MPRFQPKVQGEGEMAFDHLAAFCDWFAGQPGVPATVGLRAQIRRPLPLGLGRFLGLRRVAWGPVPGVRGWTVRWHEAGPEGSRHELAFLVTRSGRTYRMGNKTAALFSDPHGYPPQPNPVTLAQAARIQKGLRAMLADPSAQPSARE